MGAGEVAEEAMAVEEVAEAIRWAEAAEVSLSIIKCNTMRLTYSILINRWLRRRRR